MGACRGESRGPEGHRAYGEKRRQRTRAGSQAQPGTAPVRTAKSERRVLISRTMGELLKMISDKAGHELLLEKARALETHLSPLLGKK